MHDTGIVAASCRCLRKICPYVQISCRDLTTCKQAQDVYQRKRRDSLSRRLTACVKSAHMGRFYASSQPGRLIHRMACAYAGLGLAQGLAFTAGNPLKPCRGVGRRADCASYAAGPAPLLFCLLSLKPARPRRHGGHWAGRESFRLFPPRALADAAATPRRAVIPEKPFLRMRFNVWFVCCFATATKEVFRETAGRLPMAQRLRRNASVKPYIASNHANGGLYQENACIDATIIFHTRSRAFILSSITYLLVKQ